MPTVTTSDNVTIYFKDWGSGQPVVFSHGWPLNADVWDGPANFVASHGFRASPMTAGVAAAPASRGRATTSTTTPTTLPPSSSHSTLTTSYWSATPLAAAKSPATSAGTAPPALPRWFSQRHPAADAEDCRQPGGAAHRAIRRDS